MTSAKTKYWAFTWTTNANQKKLVSSYKLKKVLDQEFAIGVFQLEKGAVAGKLHYQGRLEVLGPRVSKKHVLEVFSRRFKNTAALTLSPVSNRAAIDAYVQKLDTKTAETQFCGLNEVYDNNMANKPLRYWQSQLLEFLTLVKDDPEYRTRKILYVEDRVGNSGKSFFTKYLRTGQKVLKAFKLPVNNVDRLLSATNLLVKREQQIDLIVIDITRTMGSDQHLEDLWAAIEDIKNGHVLDVMYGKFNEAIFEPPLVVVFTNQKMQDHADRLSQDRWMHLFLNSNSNRSLEHHIHHEDGSLNSFKLENIISELQSANRSSDTGVDNENKTDTPDNRG